MVPTPMYMAYLLRSTTSFPTGARSILLSRYGKLPDLAMRRKSRALGRARRASVSWS
jgi:hypothetical protein